MRNSPKMLNRAKSLRSNMTEAEELLWQEIRAHRLGGLSFRRQVPKGHYIVDFYCAKHSLVVELDGFQHGEDATQIYDDERTRWLQADGLRIVRFWNDEVLRNMDEVCYAILHHCGLIDEDAKSQLNSQEKS